ncbi:MAG: zinc ribbon domain-containing protein [Betaproteobacteria bacterium]|nr:zinc ribbon domain-containing protein [Betaproteobacteria bacterium]
MPIYEYVCNSCGAEKEHFQKMSDEPIVVCPVCGSSNYQKMISAAGFQLKGSGWYVTDFRDNNKPAKPTTEKTAQPATKTETTQATPATTTNSTKTESTTTAK